MEPTDAASHAEALRRFAEERRITLAWLAREIAATERHRARVLRYVAQVRPHRADALLEQAADAERIAEKEDRAASQWEASSREHG